MNEYIETTFDKQLNGYIVNMPWFISFHAIEEWGKKFALDLMTTPPTQQIIMLVDTNRHQFESIQCLKSLREFFTENVTLQSRRVKVAFVQPPEIGPSFIKSEFEAYFNQFEQAYRWLNYDSNPDFSS